MTFWKSSKRREGAISDPKILVADLSTSRKKRTTVFGNKGGAGEGVTGRLEVFRKFIQNGTVKRPLIPLHTPTNKRTCESMLRQSLQNSFLRSWEQQHSGNIVF